MVNLSLDFVNSSWYVTHKLYKEILTDTELLMDFFKKRGFDIDILPNKDVMNELLELRSYITGALNHIVNNELVPKKELFKLNTYIELTTYKRVFHENKGKYELSLRPMRKNWDWIISEIAASFIELLSNYDISRLKVCQNPDCKWFFYDESKSHTKRWCDETCASLMKVRKFRAKQKDLQSEEKL